MVTAIPASAFGSPTVPSVSFEQSVASVGLPDPCLRRAQYAGPPGVGLLQMIYPLKSGLAVLSLKFPARRHANLTPSTSRVCHEIASFEVQTTVFKLAGGIRRLPGAVQVTISDGADGS